MTIEQTLKDRTNAIATSWHDVLMTIDPQLDAEALKAHVAAWTEAVIDRLLAEGQNHTQIIGEALAREVSPEPLVLGLSQRTLAAQLMEGLSAEDIPELYPQVMKVLTELAIGFVRESQAHVESMRGEFLSSTVHDLRSPLNAIIGFSRVILKGIDGPTTDIQKQDLTAIYKGGQELLEDINAVFDIEKIEVNRIELNPRELSVPSLLKQVTDDLQPSLAEMGNTLELEVNEEVNRMWSDAKKLKLILGTLVAHANRLTREGSISVSVTPQPDEGVDGITFRIADDGLGMSAQQLASFRRATDPRALEYGPIDLTVSQRYAQVMGGRMDVESTPNQGTMVTLWLPIEMPESDPAKS